VKARRLEGSDDATETTDDDDDDGGRHEARAFISVDIPMQMLMRCSDKRCSSKELSRLSSSV